MQSRIISTIIGLMCAGIGLFKLYFAFQLGMQYPQHGWKFALLVLPISASWLWVGLSLALFRRAAFTAVLLLLAVQFIVNPLISVAEVAAVKEPFEQVILPPHNRTRSIRNVARATRAATRAVDAA